MQSPRKISANLDRIKLDRFLNLGSHRVVASIDKHTRTSYLYALDLNTGEILADRNITGGNAAIVKSLSALGAKRNTMVLTEAGNQGFSFYRQLKKSGYACQLIAPSSIPHRGKGRKTDRDDAVNNLHFHFSGSLRYVWVLDAADEDCRELLRYRYNQVWRISKQKQRIRSLIKRHGLEYTLTKACWTKTYYKWLKSVDLLPMTRLVVDTMVRDLEEFQLKLNDIDNELDLQFSENPHYARLKGYYEIFPGIGRIGSMTLILEGHDLKRFPRPGSLMNYTGLIPGKNASGERDPHLRITKAGNRYLRLALVCAAKYYRDRRFMHSKKDLAEMAEPIGGLMEKCQNRLHARYRHLCRRGKHSNKAKTAIARELCGFLWEFHVKIIPALENTQQPALKKAA